ncbi:MAG: hypothetical protein IRY95_01545 [Clostridia bacterium]|nr:hypothetical protein [Clostridia bacterium]
MANVAQMEHLVRHIGALRRRRSRRLADLALEVREALRRRMASRREMAVNVAQRLREDRRRLHRRVSELLSERSDQRSRLAAAWRRVAAAGTAATAMS